MTDLVRICHAPKADFSTAPWGVLKVVDGEVELDVAKAFNRARRMYQAGANTTNILRRGVWETTVPFDYTHPRYWILLRRYLAILRQPYQYEGFHGRGATVELEIFDGSSDKNWMYDDWPEAERLIRLMIQNTVDLPYVKLRLGNELNQPAVIPFAKKAYPVFKEYGLIPDNYGATYSPNENILEALKGYADNLWQMETTKGIFRDVHGVRDATSSNLIDVYNFWFKKRHPIRIGIEMDGVFDGHSLCDRTVTAAGRLQVRPSNEEWASAVRFTLDNAKNLFVPKPIDTKVRFSFSILPKAPNKDGCTATNIQATSLEYERKFGVLPENYGQYPNDWIEYPPLPEPLPPPPVPPPAPPEKPCSYFWETHNYTHWLRCILFGKH